MLMKIFSGFTILALGATLFLVGCKNADTSNAVIDAKKADVKAETNGNWTKYTVDGVSVRAPKEWKGSALDAASISKIESVLKSGNPGDQKVLEMIRAAAAQGMTKLVVLNPKSSDNFSENLNLVVENLPSKMSSEQYAETAASQLKNMSKPGTEPKVSSFDTPAGKAGVIRSTLQVPGPAGARTDVSSSAYVLVKDTKAYVFTFSCNPMDAETERPLFEKIMKTVTLP